MLFFYIFSFPHFSHSIVEKKYKKIINTHNFNITCKRFDICERTEQHKSRDRTRYTSIHSKKKTSLLMSGTHKSHVLFLVTIAVAFSLSIIVGWLVLPLAPPLLLDCSLFSRVKGNISNVKHWETLKKKLRKS